MKSIAQLRAHVSRRVADIGCGTGILAERIRRELGPDEVYGVDMSDGMLAQARQQSGDVRWMKGPAELREFHRVLAPGGLAAVATISPRRVLPLQLRAGSVRPAW